MNTQMKEKTAYEAPEVQVFAVKVEGVVCASMEVQNVTVNGSIDWEDEESL